MHCYFAENNRGAQAAQLAGERGKAAGALVLCLQDGLFPLLLTVLGKAVSQLISLKKE